MLQKTLVILGLTLVLAEHAAAGDNQAREIDRLQQRITGW